MDEVLTQLSGVAFMMHSHVMVMYAHPYIFVYEAITVFFCRTLHFLFQGSLYESDYLGFCTFKI